MTVKKKFDAIQCLGIIAIGLTLVTNVLSSFVSEKKTDALITEIVNKAVAQLTKKD
jgi:hypothetical protein